MVLPDGLRFLAAGWWLVHAIAILFGYQLGYARGRGRARRQARARELERGGR